MQISSNPLSEPPAPSSTGENASVPSPHTTRFRSLVLGCIGVVYGDIGTSPLYAFREAINAATGGDAARIPEAVWGVCSLIIWALMIIVTMKYVMFLLRADNRGEGGILSLMALAQKGVGKKFGVVFMMGLAGAALFYGDATITPAISVLSAIEGLNLITPAFDHVVLLLTLIVLVIFFMMQKRGTARVSTLFGPVMVVWFAVIGAAGLFQIARMPEILLAVNPVYAARFLFEHQGIAMAVLGAVFLAVTGAEALYADLGHFGRRPIQAAWLFLVFPCLTLNYLGQGALVVQAPEAVKNPFYLMMPGWALLPMVVLATAATIIASQAVVTGAFSLTRQAIQLGLLPRLVIRHTSSEHEGQIFMPRVNTLLLVMVLFLCCLFRNSSAIASAYGIAVTGTMVVTTILAFIVVRRVWRKRLAVALCLVSPFLAVETVFLCANLQKIMDGGYVPLMLAAALMGTMWIWVRGTRYLYDHDHHRAVSLTDLVEMLDRDMPERVEGTAIFLTSDPIKAPMALMQNLRHNKVLHEHNIILTVITTHVPKLADDQRMIVEPICSSITRIILMFGYGETPDVPRALRIARDQGFDVHLQDASFFLGRRSIVSLSTHRLQQTLARAWHEGASPHKKTWLNRHDNAGGIHAYLGLPQWQAHIYISMANGAVAATDFFKIPRNQVVELGMQMSI